MRLRRMSFSNILMKKPVSSGLATQSTLQRKVREGCLQMLVTNHVEIIRLTRM